jgi:4-amino-4-deoxy-L-arabinose transferase-like glycosyltransferase
MDRTFLNSIRLPITVFLFTFLWHVVHIEAQNWGAGLLPVFAESDTYYYLHKAWCMAFLDSSGGELSTIIPLSPYISLLAGAYRILGPYPAVPFLINAILVSAAAALVAVATRRIFDDVTAWVAGAMIVLCGPIVFFAGLTIKTNLELFLLAATVYLALRYFSRPKWWWLAAAVASAAVLSIERNNMAVLIPWLAGLAVAPHVRTLSVRGLLPPLAAIIVTLLVVAGSVAWEPAKVEQRFFSPIGLNFYVGNAPNSVGTYTYVAGFRNDLVGHHTDAVRVAERSQGRPLSPGEVSNYWFGQSFRYISSHPLEYAALQLKKVALILAYTAHGSPEEYRVWRWERPALAMAIVDYGVVLAFFVVGIAVMRQRVREPAILFLLGSIVLYALTLWIFFVHERYKLPLVVLMAPIAAHGVVSAARSPSFTKLKYFGIALGIYMVSILLTYSIAPQPGWSADLTAARARELTRARAQASSYRLKQEVVLAPTPEAWIGLSKDLFTRSFRRDARTAAERAIELAPRDPRTYWNLFLFLARENDKEGLRVLSQRISDLSDKLDRRRFDELQQEIERRRARHE